MNKWIGKYHWQFMIEIVYAWMNEWIIEICLCMNE